MADTISAASLGTLPDSKAAVASALVKCPVPLARHMLLTETFHAAGRSAMILDAVSTRPGMAAGIPENTARADAAGRG